MIHNNFYFLQETAHDFTEYAMVSQQFWSFVPCLTPPGTRPEVLLDAVFYP